MQIYSVPAFQKITFGGLKVLSPKFPALSPCLFALGGLKGLPQMSGGKPFVTSKGDEWLCSQKMALTCKWSLDLVRRSRLCSQVDANFCKWSHSYIEKFVCRDICKSRSHCNSNLIIGNLPSSSSIHLMYDRSLPVLGWAFPLKISYSSRISPLPSPLMLSFLMLLVP